MSDVLYLSKIKNSLNEKLIIQKDLNFLNLL